MNTTYLRKLVLAVVILTVSKVIGEIVYHGKETSVATFVITETGKYNSLDPLDGDSSQNLPVARMLYATPLEINLDNTLTSRVLESFTYNQSKRTITWIVKKDISYSDGTNIKPEDIAFAVSRMAYTRPGFPLIKLISGLSDWLKKENPLSSLPSGIKVEGNHISIELVSDYPHPLFRFCLELFSIIPKSCVNLTTNKIECERIPSSGYYNKVEETSDSVTFEKRSELTSIQGKSNYPQKIKFSYMDIPTLIRLHSTFSERTVIQSSEAKLSKEQLTELQTKLEVSFTPAAWFTFLQINPNVEPFNDKECRVHFAEVFRKNFSATTHEVVEGSIFTKLVQGYLPLNEMIGSQNASNDCLRKFAKSKVRWGFDPTTPEPFIKSILLTAKELGIEIEGPRKFKDKKEEVEAFLNKDSAFIFSRTGFWALDPTGDIQMLFTPNLHKLLKDFWTDDMLQNYLKSIVKNGEVSAKTVNDVNKYIFSDAKMNVYSHIRRFYASKNRQLVENLPIGITSPSPWHLFSGVE